MRRFIASFDWEKAFSNTIVKFSNFQQNYFKLC